MDKIGQSLTSSLCVRRPFVVLQLLKSLWLGSLANYFWKATQIISDSPPLCIQIHSQINALARHGLSFKKQYGVFINYMHLYVPAKASFILQNSFYPTCLAQITSMLVFVFPDLKRDLKVMAPSN